ncbi:MAG TPA: hypothetical protein PLG20_07500, partial [Candidatus Syntrophosphaera sp.]|nr:hypothetical protein [Candidatus Syntrophosphaera sp.]
MTAKQFFAKYKHHNGARVIQILVRYEGRKLDVLELCHQLYQPGASARDARTISPLDIPMIDLQALKAYRKRVAELTFLTTEKREELSDAKLLAYQEELAALKKELRHVTYANGRIKMFPLEGDKAYHAVLNSVKRLKFKARYDSPEAYNFIRDHVVIGRACYINDPAAALDKAA